MKDGFALLLQAPAFWLGAIIFLLSQWGKFSEFGSDARFAVAAPSSTVLQLKPRDLTSASTFNMALFAFLLVSAMGYALLCLLPPTVFFGWHKIVASGQAAANAAAQEKLDPSLFPLIISAALVGLTQPVPGFDKIANIQKEIFHQWIGVPDKVIGTAISLSSRLLSKAKADPELNDLLDRLLREDFIKEIEAFADVVYFRDYLKRVNLEKDAQIASVKGGSSREKSFVIRDLILVLCVAVVREEGGSALPQLSKALDVDMPVTDDSASSAVGGGILIVFLVGMFLWVAMSLEIFQANVPWLVGVTSSKMWPASPYVSSQYLLANYIPIILSSLIVVTSLGSRRTSYKKPRPFIDIIHDSYVLVLSIFVLVIFYDYIQSLVDIALAEKDRKLEISSFLTTRLFYFSVHALISASTAFFLILFIERCDRKTKLPQLLAWGAGFVAVAAVTALANALARKQYQFGKSPDVTADFHLLVIVLNVVAAAVAFYIAIVALRRFSRQPVRVSVP